MRSENAASGKRCARYRQRHVGGFVQILVLAGLATVAGLLTAVLSDARQWGENGRSIERLTAGMAVAESGVRRLLAAINDPTDDLESRVGVDGVPFPFGVAEHSLDLAIEGEAGKIDVLAADRAVLLGYLQDLHLTEENRAFLVQAIDSARLRTDGPAAMDALFSHLLPVVSSELIEQDFTLLSGLAGIDPMLASERVLAALPDISDIEAKEIVRLRRTQPLSIAGLSIYFASGRPLFTLVATVHWNETETTTKRVPIEITTAGRALVTSGFR
jgi:hypothetical protein